jgi:hypothetical protein
MMEHSPVINRDDGEFSRLSTAMMENSLGYQL